VLLWMEFSIFTFELFICDIYGRNINSYILDPWYPQVYGSKETDSEWKMNAQERSVFTFRVQYLYCSLPTLCIQCTWASWRETARSRLHYCHKVTATHVRTAHQNQTLLHALYLKYCWCLTHFSHNATHPTSTKDMPSFKKSKSFIYHLN
jgi:hypothetical protein